MERAGGVRDLFVGRTRHVAIDAAIVPSLRQESIGLRKLAPLFSMTIEAALAVVHGLLPRVRQLVGVVARDAAHLAPALAEATALLHLLDLAEEAGPAGRLATFTNTDSMDVKGSPGRKSVSFRPARTTRISPCRWHCWQTASRS